MLEELDGDLVALLLGDREADLLWDGLLDLDRTRLVRIGNNREWNGESIH